MIATQYAPLARRTLKELPRDHHFIHMGLGLCGEVGEFIDAVKKSVIYGKALDLTNLCEETGDDFWYTANLLTELGVSAEVLQRAIDKGYVTGRTAAAGTPDPFEQCRILLQLNFNVATIAMGLANKPEMYESGGSHAVQVIEALGNTFGALCGLYGLDPAQAMDLNIKKLAKRYGDKYSDLAALNRDTGAERRVLEGGNVVQFPDVGGAPPQSLPRPPELAEASGEQLRAYAEGGVLPEGTQRLVGENANDFELPAKACDKDRPESCENCQ